MMYFCLHFRDLADEAFGLWFLNCKAISKNSRCTERKFNGKEFPEENFLLPFINDKNLPELVSTFILEKFLNQKFINIRYKHTEGKINIS